MSISLKTHILEAVNQHCIYVEGLLFMHFELNKFVQLNAQSVLHLAQDILQQNKNIMWKYIKMLDHLTL
jgi:hypothetical protein